MNYRIKCRGHGRNRFMHCQKHNKPGRDLSAAVALAAFTRIRLQEESLVTGIFTADLDPGTAGIAVRFTEGPNGALTVFEVPRLTGDNIRDIQARVLNRRTAVALAWCKACTLYKLAHGWRLETYDRIWKERIEAVIIGRGYLISRHERDERGYFLPPGSRITSVDPGYDGDLTCTVTGHQNQDGTLTIEDVSYRRP